MKNIIATAAILVAGTTLAEADASYRYVGSFRYVDRVPETMEARAVLEASVDGEDAAGTLTLEGPLSGTWSVEGSMRDGGCRFESRERGIRIIFHGDCWEGGFSGLFQYEGEMRGGGSFKMAGGATAAGLKARSGYEGADLALGGPSPGLYVCSTLRASASAYGGGTMQRALRGSFTLEQDGTYRWMESGDEGEWAFDGATGAISWDGGMLDELGAGESSYDAERGIRIAMGDGKRWSCWTDR